MRGRQYKNTTQEGFSLVEMMISVVLGLLIALAVGSIFIASTKTIRTTQALSTIQENARIAFEMMGRDLREAGGNPCASGIEIGSTLNTMNSVWWQEWKGGLKGYTGESASLGTAFGQAEGERVLGTEAIDIHSAMGQSANVVAKMPSASANIEVDSSAGFETNDLVLVCDTDVAFIFQVTQVQGSGTKLQHNSGAGSPGNCGKPFSYDDPCNNSATGYLFENDGMVAKLKSVRWYIGNNAEGGRSLYKSDLINTGNTQTPTVLNTMEIARGVENMNITYFVKNSTDYITADAVTDWKAVTSVKVEMELSAQMEGQREENMGVVGDEIKRDMTQIISLRNRY